MGSVDASVGTGAGGTAVSGRAWAAGAGRGLSPTARRGSTTVGPGSAASFPPPAGPSRAGLSWSPAVPRCGPGPAWSPWARSFFSALRAIQSRLRTNRGGLRGSAGRAAGGSGSAGRLASSWARCSSRCSASAAARTRSRKEGGRTGRATWAGGRGPSLIPRTRCGSAEDATGRPWGTRGPGTASAGAIPARFAPGLPPASSSSSWPARRRYQQDRQTRTHPEWPARSVPARQIRRAVDGAAEHRFLFPSS